MTGHKRSEFEADAEAYRIFCMVKHWFETKWDRPFVVGELKQGRNL